VQSLRIGYGRDEGRNRQVPEQMKRHHYRLRLHSFPPGIPYTLEGALQQQPPWRASWENTRPDSFKNKNRSLCSLDYKIRNIKMARYNANMILVSIIA